MPNYITIVRTFCISMTNIKLRRRFSLLCCNLVFVLAAACGHERILPPNHLADPSSATISVRVTSTVDQTAKVVVTVKPTAISSLSDSLLTDPVALLAHFHWSIKNNWDDYIVDLPRTFEIQPGAYPIGLYWAYNSALSRAVGLDYKDYLGQEVTLSIYNLNEALPPMEPSYPFTEARTVLLSYQGKIIGGWIEPESSSFSLTTATALDGRRFEQIVDMPWEEWLVHSEIIDSTNEVELRLAPLTPEEMISSFYNAISEGDYSFASAHFSGQYWSKYMGYGLAARSEIPRMGSMETFLENIGLKNIRFVKVERVKREMFPTTEALYSAVVDIMYKEELGWGTGTNGQHIFFFTISGSGDKVRYRIDDIGSGP